MLLYREQAQWPVQLRRSLGAPPRGPPVTSFGGLTAIPQIVHKMLRSLGHQLLPRILLAFSCVVAARDSALRRSSASIAPTLEPPSEILLKMKVPDQFTICWSQ